MTKFYYVLFGSIAILLVLAFAILSYLDRTIFTTMPFHTEELTANVSIKAHQEPHQTASSKKDTAPPSTANGTARVKTPLSPNLRLVGTTVFGEKSSAIIEDQDRHIRGFYKIGDMVRGFTITDIQKDSVTLVRKNQRLVLPLMMRHSDQDNEEEFFKKVGEDSWFVSADKVTDMVSHIDQYVGQVIAYQYREDGNPAGFKIRHLKAGNDFEKMGIENGDIIKSVNGLEINTLSDVLKAVYQLSDDTSFVVEVERDNQRKELNYQLDKEVNALVPIISSMLSLPTGN